MRLGLLLLLAAAASHDGCCDLSTMSRARLGNCTTICPLGPELWQRGNGSQCLALATAGSDGSHDSQDSCKSSAWLTTTRCVYLSGFPKRRARARHGKGPAARS